MKKDFTVVRIGTDTSGRGLYMTRYMRDWWEGVVRELGFRPTIVQGAFMTKNGGGAAASAGYHDKGGCLDLRTWNLTSAQVEQVIRVCRKRGAGAWRRDHRHGMDPHIHLVLGSDRPLSSGAAYQWQQYLNGRNGLASNGPDYEWRPKPLVTEPPAEEDWFDVKTDAEIKALIKQGVREVLNEDMIPVPDNEDPKFANPKGKVSVKRALQGIWRNARGVAKRV